MISIVFNTKNSLKFLPQSFNTLYSQINNSDEIYIIDLNSLDGTSKDTFPITDERISYSRYIDESETEILNQIIPNLKNNYILFLDANFTISLHFIKNLKLLIEKHPDKILFGEASENNFKYIKPLEAIPIDYHKCNMSNICFPKEMLIKNTFSELFNKNKSNSHGIHVCSKFNGKILFSKNLHTKILDNNFRNNKQQELLDYLIKNKVSNNENLDFSCIISEDITLKSFCKNYLKITDILHFSELSKSKGDLLLLNSTINDKSFKKMKSLYTGNSVVLYSQDYEDIEFSNSINIVNDNITGILINKKQIKGDTFTSIISGIGEEDMNVIKVGPNKHARRVRPTKEERSTNIQRKQQPRRPKLKKSEVVDKKQIINKRKSSMNIIPPKETIISSYTGRKPRILFITDVQGWAWWIKSNYLKKYLSNEFDIDIISLIGKNKNIIDFQKYDLYFTFGHGLVSKISSVPFYKRITGVTAHRILSMLKPKMQLAYATHANSILLLNELNKIHDRTFYLPNGVDTDLFIPKTPLLSNKEIIFGHVGKLSPNKGQKEYIEPAIKRAKVRYFSHYNNHSEKIPHDKMVDIYKNFDIFMIASKEDGTPCPGLEAMACGRPVISNRIGNMPEIIKDGYNGFIVEKTIDAYIEKIKWFQNNKDKIKEMGINARKTILEGWTWEIQAENYRKMFKSLLYME